MSLCYLCQAVYISALTLAVVPGRSLELHQRHAAAEIEDAPGGSTLEVIRVSTPHGSPHVIGLTRFNPKSPSPVTLRLAHMVDASLMRVLGYYRHDSLTTKNQGWTLLSKTVHSILGRMRCVCECKVLQEATETGVSSYRKIQNGQSQTFCIGYIYNFSVPLQYRNATSALHCAGTSTDIGC